MFLVLNHSTRSLHKRFLCALLQSRDLSTHTSMLSSFGLLRLDQEIISIYNPYYGKVHNHHLSIRKWAYCKVIIVLILLSRQICPVTTKFRLWKQYNLNPLSCVIHILIPAILQLLQQWHFIGTMYRDIMPHTKNHSNFNKYRAQFNVVFILGLA